MSQHAARSTDDRRPQTFVKFIAMGFSVHRLLDMIPRCRLVVCCLIPHRLDACGGVYVGRLGFHMHVPVLARAACIFSSKFCAGE